MGSKDRTDSGTLGSRVREARVAAGYSQEQLAKAIGTTREAISQLERGDSQTMRADNLLRIADTLQVSPGILVFGKEEPRSLAQRSGLPGRLRPLVGWAELGRSGAVKANNKNKDDGIPAPYECSEKAFWTQAPTDACAPAIGVGDLVLVDPEASVSSGDYVVVLLGGEYAVRRIIIDAGRRYADMTGPAWSGQPRALLGDEDHILGRIVGACRML